MGRGTDDLCEILTSSAPGPIIGICVDGVGPSLVLCDGLMIMYGSTMFLIQVLTDLSRTPCFVDHRRSRAGNPHVDAGTATPAA